jgi:hypothetical protein
MREIFPQSLMPVAVKLHYDLKPSSLDSSLDTLSAFLSFDIVSSFGFVLRILLCALCDFAGVISYQRGGSG